MHTMAIENAEAAAVRLPAKVPYLHTAEGAEGQEQQVLEFPGTHLLKCWCKCKTRFVMPHSLAFACTNLYVEFVLVLLFQRPEAYMLQPICLQRVEAANRWMPD